MPLGIDYVRIDLVDTITLNEPCARLIRGEPERAPNTRETGSGVYIYIYLFIYLCVILHAHGNDLMRMLNHHVLEGDR